MRGVDEDDARQATECITSNNAVQDSWPKWKRFVLRVGHAMRKGTGPFSSFQSHFEPRFQEIANLVVGYKPVDQVNSMISDLAQSIQQWTHETARLHQLTVQNDAARGIATIQQNMHYQIWMAENKEYKVDKAMKALGLPNI